MALGERLKTERERLGFNQTDFASLVGASKRTQIGWEQERSFPDIQALAVWVGEGLDAIYVLTGNRPAPTVLASENRTAPTALASDEEILLDSYRALAVQEKRRLLASVLAGDTAPSKGIQVTGDGNKTAGRDINENT